MLRPKTLTVYLNPAAEGLSGNTRSLTMMLNLGITYIKSCFVKSTRLHCYILVWMLISVAVEDVKLWVL